MQKYQQLILGHIVTAFNEIPNGYLAIHNSKIALIGDCQAGIPEADQVWNFNDQYIFPAAIDAQVHSRSQIGQEDFIWSTQSAAVGGVGTIVDMPYDAGNLICNAQRFAKKKKEAEQQARVDFALYGTVHPDEKSSKIDEIVKEGAIGFKFSTFGTDPERFPRISPKTMHECMQKISRYGLVVGVHNEDDETVKQCIEECRQNAYTDYSAHSASRPIYAENLAINQIYELGVDTKCRAHVVHCSNSRGYDICRSYRQQGYACTISLSEDK